jgi:hypothetical protein
MSEHRAPVNAAMDQEIPHLARISPPAGRKILFFFTKKSLCEFFVKKIKNTMLPQANLAITGLKRPVCVHTAYVVSYD